MACLPEHDHAFVDRATNTVLNIAVFHGHDQTVLQAVNAAQPGDTYVVCCCDYGVAYIGGTWDPAALTFNTPPVEVSPADNTVPPAL